MARHHAAHGATCAHVRRMYVRRHAPSGDKQQRHGISSGRAASAMATRCAAWAGGEQPINITYRASKNHSSRGVAWRAWQQAASSAIRQPWAEDGINADMDGAHNKHRASRSAA